jgi:hypothetical protein
LGRSQKAKEMKKRNLFIIIILVFQLIFSASVSAKDAFIKKLVITNLNNEIVVYFNLDGAFTEGIVETIRNGIPTTFTFVIELNKVKSMWFDSSLLYVKIYRTIEYDSLKKQYIVTQTINGGAEEELKKTLDFAEAKKSMNEFNKTSVISAEKLEKGNRYELGVKAELDKVKLPFYLEYILFFVSIWDFETDWHIEEFIY